MGEIEGEISRDVGRRAEEMALDYLLKKGLKLRERNWYNRHREIDLIMESDEFVHIVEVRSLKNSHLVLPKETVLPKKQKFLIKAASSYIFSRNIQKEVVFDIVSIVFKGDEAEIEYIPNAFLPLCLNG